MKHLWIGKAFRKKGRQEAETPETQGSVPGDVKSAPAAQDQGREEPESEPRQEDAGAEKERKRQEAEAEKERKRQEAEAEKERKRQEAEAEKERKRQEAEAEKERKRQEAEAEKERKRLEEEAEAERLRLEEEKRAREEEEQRRLMEQRRREMEALLASGADPERGLTADQVQARVESGLANVPVQAREVTLRDIIRYNVCTYFNLIFLIIAVCLCLVGSYRDITFLPIIIANTLIGIVQEWRAKKLLDRLNIMTAPGTRVIRDGTETVISPSDLVQGDLAVFGPGSQIPADAIVSSGSVQVIESPLTGEADEISKMPGDRLLSGSYVISGTARAILDQVGEKSYISRLTLEAKARTDGEQSEMIRSLDRLVKIVGILIIPIAALLFSQQYWINHASLKQSVTATAAAIIGMIPEGLYLLASVAMAVSAMRLAMNKVLIHSMKSIETLARVDVLCVDKTGTITENTMQVVKVVPLVSAVPESRRIAQTSPAAMPADEAQGEGDVPQDALPGETAAQEAGADLTDQDPAALSALELAVGDFAAAMSADNATMHAIRTRFTRQSGRRAERVVAFSPVYKYSAARIGGVSYVLGAPEYILGDGYGVYEELVDSYAARGYRVLFFGEYDHMPEEGALIGRVKPTGMILLMNPVREKAPDTFRYFARQGVAMKVISGDSPVTVSEVARQAGIEGAEQYVDARSLTAENMQAACEKYTVFGRVTPQQKRLLVEAMKKAGHTVAMTGDGVNDILAMKEADCSIAMASGADAAMQTAQIVLVESDFAKMPSVVAEGRRVVNNIERTASLFLVKNIFSLLLSVFSIIFLMHYPLEPSQVSLISMFTIGIPAFFMSLESNHRMIRGHFLGNVFFRALPAGLTDFAVISALVLFCQECRVSSTDLSTSCTILLAVVGIMILYRIMLPMTKFHWVLWTAMIFGILFCMTFLNHIFAITMLSRKCAMLLIIFAIITEPSLRYTSLLTEKLWKLGRALREKWRQQKEAHFL